MNVPGHPNVPMLVMKACSILDDNMLGLGVMFHDLLKMCLGVIE